MIDLNQILAQQCIECINDGIYLTLETNPKIPNPENPQDQGFTLQINDTWKIEENSRTILSPINNNEEKHHIFDQCIGQPLTKIQLDANTLELSLTINALTIKTFNQFENPRWYLFSYAQQTRYWPSNKSIKSSIITQE